jgi:peptidoglycan/xylan/chitin deacetylase (PgdA/CDA1 family)
MLLKNFLFHRVSNEQDQFWPPMKPALFEKIIQTLSRSHNVISLEEYHQTNSSQIQTRKLVTILFDDGFKDNIVYAAPILERYKCPASFYIVTNCIDRNIPTWTYLLDYALQQTKMPALRLSGADVPVNLQKILLADKNSVRQLKPWIKKLSNRRRLEIVEEIELQLNDIIVPPNMMMNWEDIRQLKNAGFTIGSHSHTHPMLASLNDEKEIADELAISFNMIHQHLNERPETISYPIGSFDDRVIKLSGQAGYKLGLAVEQKFYRPGVNDLMAIPRVELYQEPWWKVKMRVSGLYQQAKKLWR